MTTFTDTRRSHIRDGLWNLLNRRRTQVPWVLNDRNTHLLCWPVQALDLYQELELRNRSGPYAKTRVRMLTTPMFKREIALRHSGNALPSYRSSKPLEPGLKEDPTAWDEFEDWIHRAHVVQGWNDIMVEHINAALDASKTRLQFRACSPELYDALFSDPSQWDRVTARDGELFGLVGTKVRAGSNPFDRETRMRVAHKLPVLLEIVRQAWAVPSQLSGCLDEGPYQRTWFN